MPELRLTGCARRPLGSYLKALGVLRLVGEQFDFEATGRWDDECFVLGTANEEAQVADFFLADYHPTPMLAPWNGRGGFNTQRDRKSEQLVTHIEASTDERLSVFRDAIRAARGVYEKASRESWDKERWVQACRADFPDEAVRWLDATVVLTDEKVFYPFLLGTGGNLGSMDLSNNFMERVGDALGIVLASSVPAEALRREWLEASLFGMGSPKLRSAAPGQFDPGSKTRELVNPWDYTLMLEGSLLFASGAARRMGVGARGTAAMPFMVTSSAVGFPSGAEQERARGEIWVPVWEAPTTVAELAHLIGEGRAAWRRSQARTGLDFARAATSLGVDRGVDGFERYSFLERHGQDMIAVPTGHVEARSRPEVPVLSQLDWWIGRVRRARELPNGVRACLRRLDAAQFDVAIRGGSQTLQLVLTEAAELETLVWRSSKLRDDQAGSPISRLKTNQWLPLMDDGSPEFRIAAAIASQRDALTRGSLDEGGRRASSMALLLRPVILDERRRLRWSERPARVPGLGLMDLGEVLATALRQRVVDAASKSPLTGEPALEGQVGVEPAFDFAVPAPADDVIAFLEGRTDVDRVEALLRGFLLLDWAGESPAVARPTGRLFDVPPTPAWAITAPFFVRSPRERQGAVLRVGHAWPQQLISDRVVDVLRDALRRLRIARVNVAPSNAAAVGSEVSGSWLAAGLLIPISREARKALLERIAPSDPIEREVASSHPEEVEQ